MSVTVGQQLMAYLAKADLMNQIAQSKLILQNAEKYHNAILIQRDSDPGRSMEYIDLILHSSINIYDICTNLESLEQQLKSM